MRLELTQLLPRYAYLPATAQAPLDGARALALMWVLGFHAIFMACLRGVDVLGPGGSDVPGLTSAQPANLWLTSWTTQPAANGDAGVDIFFCLSGFLIARIWLAEVGRTGGFW